LSEPVTRFLVGRREGGKRLDRFLHERIPGLSRTRIQRTIRERVGLSWGALPRPATPVRAGGEVRIGWVPLVEPPLEVEIPVLRRGAGWLAVDKPAGIPVHPVNTVRENSLIRMLRRQEGRESLRLVHRLDRETSGVLLLAEDPASAAFLSRAFRGGKVSKEYLAVVRGVVAADEGRIDLPIGPARASRVYTRREAGHGEAAEPAWRVARRLADRTLLRVRPVTGRRHQIRVHLEAAGHPVLGDPLYGRPDRDYLALVSGEGDPRRVDRGPARQLLHCARLRFPAPDGSGSVEVGAALPADFRAALEIPVEPAVERAYPERDVWTPPRVL
jgi:RluA family pseudouridine synthase